jgi:hypothetical protein
MDIRGRCHCGNIALALTWEPDPVEIPARACSCTFCHKHGGVWTSTPTGSLIIEFADPALATRYTFGTHTAEFHVCTRCGVVPVVTSDIADQRYAVVSVNAFEGIEPARFRRAATSFDGEGTGDRLARRQRNWIPRVVIRAAGGPP